MSKIFNLLGGTAESDRGPLMKSIAQSETSHDIKLNSLKTMGGTKPKGLKMRTNSDMNLSRSTHSTNIKKNTNDNKELNCLKLIVTQMDYHGSPVSPEKDKMKLVAQSSKFKEPILKETTMINKSPEVTNKNPKVINKSPKVINKSPKVINKSPQLNEDIFKKPSYKKKQFPKPEKLAYWYDDQHKFDYGYIEAIEKEFKDLLSKEKENIKPSKKKEKELMSDTPTLLEVPKLVFDRSFDEEHKKFLSYDLSEISDISDDDML